MLLNGHIYMLSALGAPRLQLLGYNTEIESMAMFFDTRVAPVDVGRVTVATAHNLMNGLTIDTGIPNAHLVVLPGQ